MDDPDEARTERIRALADRLVHDDPPQLMFQLVEIAGDGCYERHGVRVRPGDVVLDVGANVGVAAVWFAAVRLAGAVHCFEPAEPNLRLLRRNVAGLEACIVHPYGLSDVPRQATMTFYEGASAMSGLYADPARDRSLVRAALGNLGMTGAAAEDQLRGRYEARPLHCELRTLSDVLEERAIDRVGLLKIDVERAELDVLAGIREEHWGGIAQVVLEVHDVDGRADDIATMLRGRGFSVAREQDAAMRGTDVHMLYATRLG